MDCCNAENDMKGGKSIKMDRKIMMWGIIAILFIATLFLVFKAGTTGNVVAAQSAGSAVKSAATSAASSGMVGGC